jgi:hypothetical protein
MIGFIGTSVTIIIDYNSWQSTTAQDSLHSLLDYECLLFYCDWLVSDLRVGHFFSFRCPLVDTPQLNTQLLNSLTIDLNDDSLTNDFEWTESESYITTDGQSASPSWNKAPVWGLRPDFSYCQTVAGVLMWGSLSGERTGPSFTIVAGPRQRNHFRVRVPWDSSPYFTVSGSRLPIFVASYDSQGFGGGIRPRLRTG